MYESDDGSELDDLIFDLLKQNFNRQNSNISIQFEKVGMLVSQYL